MPIGMGQIIGIGLKIVANRDKIQAAMATIVPIIQDVRKNYPKIIDLLDDIAPGVTTPKSEPEGFSVEWLQESLNTLMDAKLIVDGEYGTATKEAVIMYQQAHSLVPDGWAGVATQASIYEELAKRK
jgi:peptidoglycan hydrolase-like protein with peptidoglycan-binding domain